jgi:predicted adenylyl cyclase CyaB
MRQAHKKIELEIKFLIKKKDAPNIREKILAIPGIISQAKTYEKTTMLDSADGRMQKEDARLRIREIKNQKKSKDSKIEFSYKKRLKADGGIKQEQEIEATFKADLQSFFQILNKMGYQITTSYERYRETYALDNVKITLDEFPFGFILEIEGTESEINNTCKLLELNKKKSYPLSCDDVYVELCNKKGIKPKDHILFNDPDMPRLEKNNL